MAKSSEGMNSELHLANRLFVRKRVLDLIDERRSAENDKGIGVLIERQIVEEEIALLEAAHNGEFVVACPDPNRTKAGSKSGHS